MSSIDNPVHNYFNVILVTQFSDSVQIAQRISRTRSLYYRNFRSSDTSDSREFMASTTDASGGLSPLNSIWMLNLS